MVFKAMKLDDYSHESREVERSKYWVQSNNNKEVGEQGARASSKSEWEEPGEVISWKPSEEHDSRRKESWSDKDWKLNNGFHSLSVIGYLDKRSFTVGGGKSLIK